jgi:hypothetical protein
MRRPLIAAVVPGLFAINAAIAQVDGTTTAMPGIAVTSPLGITSATSVGGTGIPLGATEIASPGVSPQPGNPTGTIAISGGGASCSTLGTTPGGMFGSTASFDGGGMTAGRPTSATGTTGGNPSASPDTSGSSGMCGSGSSGITASSTPASASPAGGVARTGIPLDSTEIGNLGVSSAAAVPTPGVSPAVGDLGSNPVLPTIPSVTSPPTASTATASGMGTGCSNTGTTAGSSRILPTTITPGGC